MERSLGIERTVQIKQYEPVKVFTNVDNIPLHLWADEKFMNNLSKLMIVQVYKALINEREISEALRTSEISYADLLTGMEEDLLKSLNLGTISWDAEITAQIIK
jgi:hypothetical protein